LSYHLLELSRWKKEKMSAFLGEKLPLEHKKMAA
jgi:hypothetical protein